jgi:hypothetical protein
MFEVGDCVQIAAKWRNAGDAVTIYWVKAVHGDRYIISPLGLGMTIPPEQVTVADMIEKLTPDQVERCIRHAYIAGRKSIP